MSARGRFTASSPALDLRLVAPWVGDSTSPSAPKTSLALAFLRLMTRHLSFRSTEERLFERKGRAMSFCILFHLPCDREHARNLSTLERAESRLSAQPASPPHAFGSRAPMPPLLPSSTSGASPWPVTFRRSSSARRFSVSLSVYSRLAEGGRGGAEEMVIAASQQGPLEQCRAVEQSIPVEVEASSDVYG